MPEPLPILIPLLNPNEVDASLVSLAAGEGQAIRKGDLLATLETTKSTGELYAEGDGFIIGLRFRQGDTVRAGEVLAYLAEKAGAVPPAADRPASGAGSRDGSQEFIPQGLRITQPALALARQSGLDLSRLPAGPLVTETQVRALLDQPPTPAAAQPTTRPAFDPAAILVYGGGGHGKSVIDLLRLLNTYRLAGVIDDGLEPGSTILGVPVLGGGDRLSELHGQGIRLAVNAVGGIGNISARMRVFERLAQAGMACPAVVHPTAFVEASARLSAGVQVFPHAYVGSDAEVGFGAIVNTGAIVSHDCRLGDYSNVSPGAMLAGGVQLGERVLVGMGATLNLEVKAGPGARIGNGATVKADVPAGGIVRAGTIWPVE